MLLSRRGDSKLPGLYSLRSPGCFQRPKRAIIEPDRKQAFVDDEKKQLNAKLIDSRSAVVQKADFLRFLREDGDAARKIAMADRSR